MGEGYRSYLRRTHAMRKVQLSLDYKLDYLLSSSLLIIEREARIMARTSRDHLKTCFST